MNMLEIVEGTKIHKPASI